MLDNRLFIRVKRAAREQGKIYIEATEKRVLKAAERINNEKEKANQANRQG